jgi:hypothetical protein
MIEMTGITWAIKAVNNTLADTYKTKNATYYMKSVVALNKDRVFSLETRSSLISYDICLKVILSKIDRIRLSEASRTFIIRVAKVVSKP